MQNDYNKKWRSFVSEREETKEPVKASPLFEDLEREINKFDKFLSEMSSMDLSTPQTIKEDRTLLTEEKRTLTFSDLPDIPISEIGWSSLQTTEEGEEIPSQQRLQLAQFLDNIKGNTLQEKLKSLSDFYSMGDNVKARLAGAETSSQAISEAISYLTFFKTLTQIITNFNAASAGFTFESFLAVLLGGSQIATGGGTIADFKTGAGEPVSLKLYKEGQLIVGGSYRDLVNDLIKDGKMRYICVTKNLSGAPGAQEGDLKFYSFNFTLNNVFNIFGNSKQKDSLDCMLLPRTFMASNGEDVGALGLMKKKEFPSLEEVNEMFVDQYKEEIKQSQEINPTEQEIEDMLRIIDFANNDDLYNANKTRGHDRFKVPMFKPSGQYLQRMAAEKGVLYSKMYELANKANNRIIDALANITSRSKEEKKKIKDEYYGSTKEETMARIKGAQDFYQKADDELKKKCLQVSHGYINAKSFKLSEGMLSRIANLSQPTVEGVFPEGQSEVGIGSIEIGSQKISEALSRVSKILNENIFDIFSNLKALTVNIQGYFAGGLQDDAKATEAQNNASNIEKKTEKLKGKN